MTFTDADLHSYLAGDAPEQKARAIEEALASDPSFEDRLMALDPLAPVIQTAVGDLGEGRNQPPMAPVAPAAQPQRRPLALVAGIAALVAMTLWWNTSRAPSNDWMDQVAAYQALYSAETIAIVDGDADALAQQFAHIETALGHAIPVETLQTATDLTLLRAQVLEYEGQPLAQVVFANDAGHPVALCLIKQDGAQDAIEVAERHGLYGASFGLDGFEYLLIGADDADGAAALAAQFRTALATT